MKPQFCGYYPPSDTEYERLWKEATIVLDTNVLLNLYRLPTTARDELLKVLDLLKDRLWIPYQVGLEFQRRRLTVIAAERKSVEDALESASELVADLKQKVDGLQLDKRGIGVDPQPLLADLEKANAKLIEAIQAAHKAQLDISSADPVREKLDTLLMGKIGPGPTSQKDLDDLVSSGEDRYKERVPPGFADADKEKNPNEATFVQDGIRYQRKFGDLILWRQVIEHAKTSGIKVFLLITADRKEDWWWREQGKTIGPHPELVREIMRQSAVELFWMYSSVQFVEHANKYASATVSSEAVDELKQVALAPPPRFEESRELSSMQLLAPRGARVTSEYMYMDRPDPRYVEEAVGAWLAQRHEDFHRNSHGFPDFIALERGGPHGFEVKFARNFADRMLVSPAVINSLLRGYLETREGRLSEFTLIVVIPDQDLNEIVHSQRVYELEQRLARLLGKYPVSGIMVGAVVEDRFEPLIFQSDRHPEVE